MPSTRYLFFDFLLPLPTLVVMLPPRAVATLTLLSLSLLIRADDTMTRCRERAVALTPEKVARYADAADAAMLFTTQRRL